MEYATTNPARTPRSRKTGASAGNLPDHARRKTIGYDSESERTVITVIASFSTVRAIYEQVKVSYRRNDETHDYFMDLVVEHRCGHRKAYAVKSSVEDAAEDETEEKLRLICAHNPASFASDYRLVTFDGLDPVTVANASLIARCTGDLDHEAQDAVRVLLPGLGPSVTAAEIGELSGLACRGMRAAFALIPGGLLRNPAGKRLHMDTPLTNWASRWDANQAA